MPADPGLQAERTALAWQRSALAACVNAGLLLRAGWLAHALWLALCGTLMLALAAAAAMQGWRRGHALLAPQPGVRLHPRSLRILCTGLLLCCLIAAFANLLAAWGDRKNAHGNRAVGSSSGRYACGTRTFLNIA